MIKQDKIAIFSALLSSPVILHFCNEKSIAIISLTIIVLLVIYSFFSILFKWTESVKVNLTLNFLLIFSAIQFIASAIVIIFEFAGPILK